MFVVVLYFSAVYVTELIIIPIMIEKVKLIENMVLRCCFV
jgi:hypothetical protein